MRPLLEEYILFMTSKHWKPASRHHPMVKFVFCFARLLAPVSTQHCEGNDCPPRIE